MQVRKKAFQGSKEQCCFFDNFFCVHSLVRSCTKNGAGLGTAPVSAVVLGPQAKILLTGSTIARRSGFFKAAACAANPRPAPTSSVIYGKYLIIFLNLEGGASAKVLLGGLCMGALQARRALRGGRKQPSGPVPLYGTALTGTGGGAVRGDRSKGVGQGGWPEGLREGGGRKGPVAAPSVIFVRQ